MHMRRRLFTVFCALSLVLCLVTVVLWIRTYFVPEIISWQNSKHQTNIVLVSGSFLIARATALPDQEDLPHWLHWEQNHSRRRVENYMMTYDARSWVKFGQPRVTEIFGYTFAEIRMPFFGEDRRSLVGPILPMTAVTAVLPVWSLLRIRRERLRKRRARSGLCPICAYDLRTCSDRCPECGTPVPNRPVASTFDAARGSL